MDSQKRSKLGKRMREAGKRFEKKVYKDLIDKGWITHRWQKNIVNNELVDVKPHFNPFTKSLMMNSGGFPDFICFKKLEDIGSTLRGYQIIGVESKMSGNLDSNEKKACAWYLKNNIFSKILMALKGVKRGTIKYEEFVAVKK